MKIVFLDRKTVGDDLDLSRFGDFGEVVMYDFSAPEEVPELDKDADVIIRTRCRWTSGPSVRLKA